MKLKKKKTLQIFFLIKNLNPVFFELLIDSIKDFNKNSKFKNKQIIKLRKSNKTITLFPIYLNLFSTKKISNQETEKRLHVNISSPNLIKESQKLLLSKVINKKLEPQYKVFFANLYLSRYNKINASQLIESTQILQNLKML